MGIQVKSLGSPEGEHKAQTQGLKEFGDELWEREEMPFNRKLKTERATGKAGAEAERELSSGKSRRKEALSRDRAAECGRLVQRELPAGTLPLQGGSL